MTNELLIRTLIDCAVAALDGSDDCGHDPEKCVTILKAAEVLCNDEHVRKLIYKAAEQAEIGSPQEAENILTFLIPYNPSDKTVEAERKAVEFAKE